MAPHRVVIALALCGCVDATSQRDRRASRVARTESSGAVSVVAPSSAPPSPLVTRAGRCGSGVTGARPPTDAKRSKYISVHPIRAAMLRLRPEVQGCSDGLRARGRVENVRVVVRFVIESDGSVSCSDVASQEGGDDHFAACVADAVLPVRFAASLRGRVVVNYPFYVYVEDR
jgi:hypothetical protein